MDLLRGTLDAMVLKALSWGPRHGYGVTRWIRQRTDGTLDMEDAAVYQALHRMEGHGWVDAEWGTSENNRRAKYYRLTEEGRGQLAREVRSIRRYTDAMWKVLGAETA
ncbi:MAG TPA: PadR family transcriptional regulator [Gemmatimonadota bacterium]|nr:PadR family transcriptional regulator [Gemmatimonadota bacterium]